MDEYTRSDSSEVEEALEREAAVAIIGPRQVGKTTLALHVGEARDAIYLDLETPSDRARLTNPEAYFELHEDRLVILDEVHRMPNLFEILRGVIDRGRRKGKGEGRFLLLGSGNMDVMQQSETLAGRIEYVELRPFDIHEVKHKFTAETLWLRGGFPRALLAKSEVASYRWRQSFIRTFLERDVPMFTPRISTELLGRLWVMLAHLQGSILNTAHLGRNLGVSAPTVASYIDLLANLLLVRRLQPYVANVNKRLVRTPKVFIRDSGVVHGLLGVQTFDDLLGHPVVGASWEGMLLETLIAHAPAGTRPYFYRTSAGAEIDLLLDLGARHGKWAIEIKRSNAPKVKVGFKNGIKDVKAKRAFVVHGGHDRFPINDNIEAISLPEMVDMLRGLREKG
ncbi:MAG: ATP-binding protein [Planctomycetes bacterium]|nr:ATP-binding protein [Planctomycetota bacterium]